MAMIPFRQAVSYTLVAIPLFILMGFLAADTGLVRNAFYAVNKWIGHWRGGLAISTIVGGSFFGAVCGDIIAATVTMNTMALPEMRRYKYSDQLSLGCIAAAANLSLIIPPSISMIIYCVLTEGSIGKLFIGGIFPGLLLTLLFITAVLVTCRINPQAASIGPKSSWLERLLTIRLIWPIALIIILVLGGIYGGIFSSTEAAGIGVFGVAILGLVNKKLNRKMFIKGVEETSKATGLVFLLIIGSMIFSSFIVTTEIPLTLANIIASLSIPPYLVLIVVLIFYILIGCIMDIMAVIIIVAPIFYSIFTNLGFDPVFIGLLTMVTIVMGHISPPFGVVVFVLAGMTKDVPLFTIFRGAIPFVAAMFLGLILLIAFPQITLFLPNLMK
jgi:tripartite ATP-independent transporter DctM subunit